MNTSSGSSTGRTPVMTAESMTRRSSGEKLNKEKNSRQTAGSKCWQWVIPMSIVVTLDDGRRIYNSIPIAEKYQVDATFFIITGVNSVTEYLGKVKYSHFESHSDNLHNNYVCKGGFYGSQLLCTSYDDLVKDFKTCIEKLGGESHYFAYPFFDSNATIIKALKATGYRLAFVGEADSDGYSTPQTDKYQIRRKTIFGNDSLKTFKSYLPESE